MSNVGTLGLEEYRQLFEDYRQWFLNYLDQASRVLEVEENVRTVSAFLDLFKTGRKFGSKKELQYQHGLAVKTGEILTEYYGPSLSYYTSDKVQECYRQLLQKQSVVSEIEKFCWDKLADTVETIWNEEEYDAWSFGKEEHHMLFRTDPAKINRILYYRKDLGMSNTRPIMPSEMEAGFQIHYDGLICLVPLSLKDV